MRRLEVLDYVETLCSRFKCLLALLILYLTKCLGIQQVHFNKVTAFVLLVVLEHSLFLMLWKVGGTRCRDFGILKRNEDHNLHPRG